MSGKCRDGKAEGLKSNRFFWLAVKLCGTAVFIALIVRKVDFSTVLPLLRQCRWELFLASILLQYAAAALNALRWRMLWPMSGLAFHKYLYFIFMGYFFNAFLPSAALSDAARVLAFGRKYGNVQENIGVNLLARAMGACAMFLVAGGTALIYIQEWKDLRLPLHPRWDSGILVVAAMLIAGIIAIWVTKSKWHDWRWTKAIFVVLRNKGLALRIFALSLLLQIIVVCGTYVLFLSLYPETRFWHMACFPVLIQLALLVPVTAGGVGLREYFSLVLFSDVAGIPANIVLGVGLLGYIPFLLLTFTGGGWVGFRQTRKIKRKEI